LKEKKFNPSQQDDIKSDLVITDFDCIPEVITTSLGLQPVKVGVKGQIKKTDPTGRDNPSTYEESVWIFRLPITNTLSVDEHIESAIKWLLSRTNEIKSLAREYSVELSIYGFSKDATRQALHVEPTISRQLADMDVALDIDVYPIEEDQLDSPEKQKQLSERLIELGIISNQDQANAFVSALSVFEACSAKVNNDLLPALLWEEFDKHEISRRVDDILVNIKAIENEIGSMTKALDNK
jgi:hypothetical protein